jgi:peroxiredoxin Q/BCP
MKRTVRTRLKSTLITAAFGLIVSSAAQAVEVGEPAPDFTLPGSDGQSYTLSELRGQHVVIAFFPKAFTGG